MNGLSNIKNNSAYQVQENKTFPINDLPKELIMKCLSFIPQKDIGNASRVCKSWNAILSSSHYATMRFESKEIISYYEISRFCKGRDIDMFKLLPKCKSLETFNFTDFSARYLPDHFRNLVLAINEIKNLQFNSCVFASELALSAVGGICNKLESLEFYKCQVLFDQLHFLNELKFLKKIKIYYCDTFNNVDFLSGLVNLKELSIYKADLSGIDSLKGLDNLLGIEKLTLSFSEIKDISNLSKFKKLKYIQLSSNYKLTDITPLKELPNLTDLRVDCCYSLVDISCLRDMKSINTLSLIQCKKITDISALFNLPNLVKIEGIYRNICDEQKFKLVTTVVTNIANYFKNENTSFAMEAFLQLPKHIKNEIYQELYDIRMDKPAITDPKFGELSFHELDNHTTTNLERHAVMMSYLEKYNRNLTCIAEIYDIFYHNNLNKINHAMELFNQLPEKIKNDIYFIVFDNLKYDFERKKQRENLGCKNLKVSKEEEKFKEPNYGKYCFHGINEHDITNEQRKNALLSYMSRYIFH